MTEVESTEKIRKSTYQEDRELVQKQEASVYTLIYNFFCSHSAVGLILPLDICLQALPLCGSSPSGFEYRQHQNQPMADLPQCFLNNSPRVSPRHTTPNGPINKVRQTDLSTHRSLFSVAMCPPKHFFVS